MNHPKDAAAYHPGDAPVTRPDLDELIGRVYFAADWAFSSAPDALQEALWEAGAAIESERARADQAEQRIVDAPHDTECEVNRTEPSDHSYDDQCDCWKSAATTAEQ